MIQRHTPLKRSGRVRPRNPKRHGKNWTRSYGSPERVAFVASLPCVVLGCKRGPCENCHAETGGMGRKADAESIFPGCPTHHRELHTVGVQTFSRLHSLDLAACAEATARAWREREAA